MPIYEYECNKCKKKFELVLMSVREKAEPECPKCKSKDARKLVSRVRYASGPAEEGLASTVESRFLKSMGGRVDDRTRGEIKQLAKTAAKRGKKRFDHMMDTGKAESVDY
ncbi:MAG: zinc ribbon domain-containing protein [Deltaproteobacteria bacterium]|nr:zinc ribbon domain-containing protein [Deltaproteobacteria bacterium]